MPTRLVAIERAFAGKSLLGFCFLLITSFASLGFVVAAEGRIDLELATAENFPVEDSRDWLMMLSKAGLEGVRIRSGEEGDRPELTTGGTEASPIYRVVGVLTADGRLLLPGGKFAKGDRAGIARWAEKLKSGGEEGLTTKPGAFGLLPRELVAVHTALAAPVNFSTLDGEPKEVVDKLANNLSLKVVLDASAEKALAADEKVADELLGISSGTGLAAILRPYGLVFVPVKMGQDDIQLRITSSRDVEKSWPVGWPSEKPSRDLLPDLFKFLNAEVKETPLGESLEAVRARLDVPLLVDHNGLARLRVDLKTTNITLPKTNTFYARILERMLSQAKLKYELRVDEAEKPLLWISPIKGN